MVQATGVLLHSLVAMLSFVGRWTYLLITTVWRGLLAGLALFWVALVTAIVQAGRILVIGVRAAWRLITRPFVAVWRWTARVLAVIWHRIVAAASRIATVDPRADPGGVAFCGSHGHFAVAWPCHGIATVLGMDYPSNQGLLALDGCGGQRDLARAGSRRAICGKRDIPATQGESGGSWLPLR